jgi:hypothetical protein
VMDVASVGIDRVAGDPASLLSSGEADGRCRQMPQPFRRAAPCAAKCDQLCHPDGVTAPLKSGCLQETERASKPGRLR